MTPDLLTLAASVVALPGWRWMPGMTDTDGRTVLAVDADGVPTLWIWCGATSQMVHGEGLSDEDCRAIWFGPDSVGPGPGPLLPDFTDAATGGCMLAMLGPCRVWIDSEGDAWMQEAGLDPEPFRTLAEACARVALARGRWA